MPNSVVTCIIPVTVSTEEAREKSHFPKTSPAYAPTSRGYDSLECGLHCMLCSPGYTPAKLGAVYPLKNGASSEVNAYCPTSRHIELAREIETPREFGESCRGSRNFGLGAQTSSLLAWRKNPGAEKAGNLHASVLIARETGSRASADLISK